MTHEENTPLKQNDHRTVRLNTEQQAEIGNILLSARAVSRQMIAQAKGQADAIVKTAEDRAAEITREAEEKTALAAEAEKKAAAVTAEAEEKASAMIAEAQRKAAAVTAEAERKASAMIADAEQKAASFASSAAAEEMQDYAVRCVEECFAKLRQKQLESIDVINEQWREFLSGLTLAGESPHQPENGQRPAGEISQADIETRVNAIARELMEIIGK